MESEIIIVQVNSPGITRNNIWFEHYIDGNLTRRILFSGTMQDDLDEDVHNGVCEAAKYKLSSEPTGEDLKVSPVQNESGTGASRIEFQFELLNS